MGELILQTEVRREPKRLYYLKGDPMAIYVATGKKGRKKLSEGDKVE